MKTCRTCLATFDDLDALWRHWRRWHYVETQAQREMQIKLDTYEQLAAEGMIGHHAGRY